MSLTVDLVCLRSQLLLLLLLLLRRRRNRNQSNTPTLIGTPPHSSGSTFVARFFGGKADKKTSAETERAGSGESGRIDEKAAAATAAGAGAAGVGLGVTGAELAGAGADRDAMAGAQDGMVHPGEVVTVLVSLPSASAIVVDLGRERQADRRRSLLRSVGLLVHARRRA